MLYNKHRPKYFKDLIGQELTKELLINFLTSKENIHSFIFYGPNGTGKTTAARLFSQAVNCSEFSKNKEICGSCNFCKSIEQGECPDLIEIDGATHNGVEYIREIIKNSVYPPLLLSKKVYIVDEAHCLSYQAWNALLKLIEEPPQHLILIFLTTAINKIIPTILSRCQKLFFSPIQTEDLNQLLSSISQAESKEITSEIITKLSENSKGSAREAIVSLEKILINSESSKEVLDNLPNLEEETLELLALIFSSDCLKAIGKLKKNFTNSNKLFELILDKLLELSFYQLSSSKEVLGTISEEQAKIFMQNNPNLNSMINFLAPALSSGVTQFSFAYSKYLLVNLFESCYPSSLQRPTKEIKKVEIIPKPKIEPPKQKEEIKKVEITETNSQPNKAEQKHSSLEIGTLLSEAIVQKSKVGDLPSVIELFQHTLLGFENVDLPQFKFDQTITKDKEIILLLRRADRETSKEYYSQLKNYLDNDEVNELFISKLFEHMVSKYELICSSDSTCIVVFPNESKANYFNLKVKNLEVTRKLYKIFESSINWKGITLSDLQTAIQKNKSYRDKGSLPKSIPDKDIQLLRRIQERFLTQEEFRFLV